MTAQQIRSQLHRARPHHLFQPPITLTVVPAKAGIQRLGSCGVLS